MTFINMIGRIVSFDSKESDSGTKYTDLRVSVMRPYKNYEGNYETDYFKIFLFENNHKKAQDHFKKGMGIALKGRLEVSKWIDDNDSKRSNINIIAEQIVFLPREIENYQNEATDA
ncbi:single-stranded DNA-binding protein [Acholeplasma granularum]|uniref:single-stranded DNA-binding protein n=1 Tax=Acholeplasma granularum TaxID=264635 RepID=UPI00046FDF52|nr:single-stranded DNA-binding protein [Acholeplasma granularum]